MRSSVLELVESLYTEEAFKTKTLLALFPIRLDVEHDPIFSQTFSLGLMQLSGMSVDI